MHRLSVFALYPVDSYPTPACHLLIAAFDPNVLSPHSPERPMYIASLIAQGLLSLVFFATGSSKLASTGSMEDDFQRFGYPRWFMFFTGGTELTGALGLALGFWWPTAAVLGAGAVVTTMIGAAATHLLRTDDALVRVLPPLLLGSLALWVLIVQGGAL
jgi:uncharacterized membrane protein YphA (DoxX/SURF4 family)